MVLVMNERIQKLEQQARAYAIKQNETTSMPYSQAYAEKYVELMGILAVGAVGEAQWFYNKANTNQLTQEYVQKQFRS
jgi:malate synthase